MKHKNKNFNIQHGGMLMELMLSVALASIMIPFVVRYQKNTIERARNIAIVKQMEIVQSALERCIFEKRSEIVRQGIPVLWEDKVDPKEIDCLILSNYKEGDERKGLVNYGLTPEFANDFKDDYKLRILKTADYTGQPVLQGVVLLNSLTNQGINSLRTREIVRLAGGQVGFLDDSLENNVQGGYNAFQMVKSDLALQDFSEGIIKTTGTMRGDSKYLWRQLSGDEEIEEEATMLSNLNLDGHDIVNVARIKASKALFRELDFKDLATAKYVTFRGANVNPNTSGTSYAGYNATVNGLLTHVQGGDKNIRVEGNFRLFDENSQSNFNEGTFSKLYVNDLRLPSNFDVFSLSLNSGSVYALKTVATTLNIANLAITPQLDIGTRVCASPNSEYCWETTKSLNIANFKDMTLEKIINREGGKGGENYQGLSLYLAKVIEKEDEIFYEYDTRILPNSRKGIDVTDPSINPSTTYVAPYNRVYTRNNFGDEKELQSVIKYFTSDDVNSMPEGSAFSSLGTTLFALTDGQRITKMKYRLVEACSIYYSVKQDGKELCEKSPYGNCGDQVYDCVAKGISYIPVYGTEIENYATVMESCYYLFQPETATPHPGSGVTSDQSSSRVESGDDRGTSGTGLNTGTSSSRIPGGSDKTGTTDPGSDTGTVIGKEKDDGVNDKTAYDDPSGNDVAYTNDFDLCTTCTEYVYDTSLTMRCLASVNGNILIRNHCQKYVKPGEEPPVVPGSGHIVVTTRGAGKGDTANYDSEYEFCHSCTEYVESGLVDECLDCVDWIINDPDYKDGLGKCISTHGTSGLYVHVHDMCEKYKGMSFHQTERGADVTVVDAQEFCNQCTIYKTEEEVDKCLDCADWRIHDLISGDLGYCVRFYDRYKNEVKARKDLEACNEYPTGMTPEDPGVNPKGGVILNEREFCINSCNKEAYIYPTYRVPCCLRCVEKVLKNPEEWGSISNCMALTCGGA